MKGGIILTTHGTLKERKNGRVIVKIGSEYIRVTPQEDFWKGELSESLKANPVNPKD